jgi:large subunit ribosomal protein L9
MEIILKQYVKGLGEKDDVVTVKDGYGRNFLIPQGMAILATKSAVKQVEETLRQRAHRQEHLVNEAQALVEQIENTVVVVETLAGQDGKLFGSVTSLMVANQLKEKGFDIDRKQITFQEDIKTFGEFEALISVFKGVKATVKIEVVAKDK